MDFIRAGHYSLPASEIEGLAADPEVAYVSLDRPVSGMLDYSMSAVNAPLAWSAGLTGSGIGVAVIDSGISLSTADLPSLVYNQDFTNSGLPTDEFGHGTHVAGILAGSGAASTQYGTPKHFLGGMATGVNLVNLKVLDASGTGSDSNVIAAVNRAIALKSQYNIRVINLSLGRPVL